MKAFIPASVEGPGTDRVQVAALCWRMHKGRVEVLLITSRETGRWVLPKGWPMTALSLAATAAREAWEEAGVQGDCDDVPIGQYCYAKLNPQALTLNCTVAVYPLHVRALKNHFPEAGQRRRVWFAATEAAHLVAEPDLRLLLDLVAADPDLVQRKNGQGPA